MCIRDSDQSDRVVDRGAVVLLPRRTVAGEVAAPGLDHNQARLTPAGVIRTTSTSLTDPSPATNSPLAQARKGSRLGRMVCSQVSAARSQANSDGVHCVQRASSNAPPRKQ